MLYWRHGLSQVRLLEMHPLWILILKVADLILMEIFLTLLMEQRNSILTPDSLNYYRASQLDSSRI